MEQILFYCFAGITIFSALFILFTRNLMYATFSLFLTFLGVAAMFVFAGADFLAIGQIMIYVGGVLILLLFGIMLTYTSKSENNTVKNEVIVQNGSMTGALILGVCMLYGLLQLVHQANFTLDTIPDSPKSTIASLGFELMTSHLLPFELIAIILMIALIGAAHLALQQKEINA